MNNKNKEIIVRDILFGEYALKSFVNAVNRLSIAVIKTLGPCGSCVIIDQGHGRVRVTKDGVTVAKALGSKNKFENMAINLIKEACIQANTIVGDSTTTSITILSSIITEGYKRIASGHSSKHIVNGLLKASNEIKKIIIELSSEATNEDLKNVATISADNDTILGSLIYKAVEKINGKYGVINVEESKSTETKLEFAEGMKISQGYLSPYFVQQQEGSLELDDVCILIINGKIMQQEFFFKFLDHISMSNKAGLVICEDLDKQLLGTMLVNNYKGTLKSVAIKAPEHGDDRLSSLQDIALVTGGKVIDDNVLGSNIDFDSNFLGSCRRIIVQKENTSIIDGSGDKKLIQERIDEIKYSIDNSIEMSQYKIEKLKERYSRLTGGVAIIKVGGSTESELNEKKDRVIDSVSAVRSTYEDGIVVGGGICHLNASKIYEQRNLIEKLNQKEQEGAKILLDALKSPLENILLNAGFEPQVIISKIIEKNNLEYGFDALKGEFCNLREQGIIDSTKSALTSLSVAVSIGRIALNTQVCISRDTKD